MNFQRRFSISGNPRNQDVICFLNQEIMNKNFKEKLWLFFTILAALSWGAWGILTKFILDDISPFVNQVLFTFGMLFTIPFIARRCKLKEFDIKGFFLGFSTGLLAISGNIMVYQAFSLGGLAAVVIPVTNLYPLVTILIALLILREKLNWFNGIGILIILPIPFGQVYFINSLKG